MKAGDRVKSSKDWMSTQIQALGGGWVTYDLYAGDEGMIYAEDSPGSGVWVIVFDKAPSEFAVVSEQWLIPSVFSLDAIFDPAPPISMCTCSLTVIMRDGCTCGHIKRYVPPHLRDKEAK